MFGLEEKRGDGEGLTYKHSHLTPTSLYSYTTFLPRFLKLMLGVAVTCTNKHSFINKIQSLDETAQVLVVGFIVLIEKKNHMVIYANFCFLDA